MERSRQVKRDIDQRSFFFELVIVIVLIWVCIDFIKGAVEFIAEGMGVPVNSLKGQLIVAGILLLIVVTITVYQDNLINAFINGSGGLVNPLPGIGS